MKVHPTPLSGLMVIKPRVFSDERGYFLETFRAERFQNHGLASEFVQDNHSRSTRGVLRGLHYTVRRPQIQTVTVSHGKVFDVAVDLRRNSPTFAKWFGLELDGDDPHMLYLPPGFAHGFCVLSEQADIHYKTTHVYDPSDEYTVSYRDDQIGIDWPVTNPILNDRDRAAPLLISSVLPQESLIR